MNYIPSTCFSGILTEAMQSSGVGGRKLEAILKENGIDDISYKRISDYANGIHTPSFEKARDMLRVLEYSIDDESLLEALKQNREIIKQESDYVLSGSKEIRRTVRIKLKKLLPEKEPAQTEQYLWNRIADLYGDEKQISLYIQELISKDLKEYILAREDA